MEKSNTSTEHTLRVFKQAIVAFMDELIDQFPQETNLILCRIFVKDQIPIETTMKNFILKIEKNDGFLKKLIQNKDDAFFLEHNVFDMHGTGMAGGTVNHFRALWMSHLDDHDRQTMWKWFDSFVALSDRYQLAISKTS
jgi:hypothetical protein